MKASFSNSVDVLIRAYMNDTLEAADCTRCAVGNLIRAAGCGDRHDFYKHGSSWYGALRQDSIDKTYHGNPSLHPDILAIGYTAAEVHRIERAFMNNSSFDNFDGLIAVVEVLASIHSVDLSTKETAVSRFHSIQESKEI